jgi:hypothetical protein
LKPQLIETGIHNADLGKSTTRIIQDQICRPKLVDVNSLARKEITERHRKAKSTQDKWYKANAEKKKQYAREYYRNHREKRLIAVKEYYKKRPHVAFAAVIKRTYGITVEQYNNLLSSQDFKCAICRADFDLRKKGASPSIDHCHSTKRVRGILCSKCNISLGHLEKEGFLEAAIKYLGKR